MSSKINRPINQDQRNSSDIHQFDPTLRFSVSVPSFISSTSKFLTGSSFQSENRLNTDFNATKDTITKINGFKVAGIGGSKAIPSFSQL